MAVATKGKDPMADDEKPETESDSEATESRTSSPAPKSPDRAKDASPGFFSIYKPGQGYWTRMLTAGAVLLLLALLCRWFYDEVVRRFESISTAPWAIAAWAFVKDPQQSDLWMMRNVVKFGFVAAIFITAAIFIWRYFNRPKTVDFLIETEKEMAKVNWTSRRELVGSTKIVIAFMFLIALVLFGYDLLFGYFFQFIGILKHGPLG